MTKEKENKSTDLQIASVLDLQTNFKKLSDNHLAQRFVDNPEFKKAFVKRRFFIKILKRFLQFFFLKGFYF